MATLTVCDRCGAPAVANTSRRTVVVPQTDVKPAKTVNVTVLVDQDLCGACLADALAAFGAIGGSPLPPAELDATVAKLSAVADRLEQAQGVADVIAKSAGGVL